VKAILISTAVVLAAVSSYSAKAQSTTSPPPAASTTSPSEQPIYGSQLMTDRERQEYRDKIRAAKTDAERDQIRKTHPDQMKARAQAKGITLPDDPPVARRVGPPPSSGGVGPGPKPSGPPASGPQGQGKGRP